MIIIAQNSTNRNVHHRVTMNKGRKLKHSLSIKDDENNSPKNEPSTGTTKHKLLTPCRRVGLNRKRKNIISGLSGSSSEINISSPNNSLTEIDISVREHDFTPETNKIHVDTPVLKKNVKPRKGSLGARRTNQTANNVILSPEEIQKYKHLNNIFSDIKIVLKRCDFDEHILNRSNVRDPSEDISMRIENEAISSTPLEANNSEIQTNQISTTIEDATPAKNGSINVSDVIVKNPDPDKVSNKSVTKKFKDLFGENSDDSDFESSAKRKKRKRFSLKISTKTNKKLTSVNEDTNDDSTQNSLYTDTEMSKSKTEKSVLDDNTVKKTKKTSKPKNNDTNDSLNETDPDISDILKTKPSKEEKSKPSKEEKTKPSKEPKPPREEKQKTPKEDKSKNKIHKRDTDSQIESDEVAELNLNVSRKKRKRSSSSYLKKSPKIVNRKEISAKPRQYNSDSDDDFMEKPRREKKDPDIKKKIKIPVPDPLNRIEHIRIRENKSYTIMHMNNISSYVKYYDNDVNLKRTESDDNQQTSSQPVVSKVKTSMIIERKNYLIKSSQESNSSENSGPTNGNSVCNENSEPLNENSEPLNENSEPLNENSEPLNENTEPLTESSEPLNKNSESINESSELLNENSGPTNKNPEPTNVNSDCNENPETKNMTSAVTEFSEKIEYNSAHRDSENTETSGFAGFSPEYVNAEHIENPEYSNINIFSENPDSNDVENSNSNDISNFNDIEKPETIVTPGIYNTDITVTNDAENPENASNVENLDDPQNEMKKMLKLKSNLINQIKMKRDKLDSLKRIMAYKEEHNLDDLTKTTLQFKYTLQEALVDLLSHLKTHTERNFNMLLLLGFLKIPSEMVGYNDETKSFE